MINKDRVIRGWSAEGTRKAKESKGYFMVLFPNGKGGFHTQWVRKEKIAFSI